MLKGAWFSSAALAGAIALSCGSNRNADPAGRFFAVHNVMHAMGLVQAGPVHQGTLVAGQEVKLEVTLPATCTSVVAVGGPGVDAMALELRDPDGRVVAERRATDVEAVLRTCVERPGTYVVRLRMDRGAGEYIVSSFTGGDAVSDKAGETADSGGTCDAPTVLTPNHPYTGSTEDSSDDAEGSCAAASGGRDRVYRLDLPTRQHVVIELSADFDSVLYVRKDECGEESAEVKCNDDSGPKRSRIDGVFEPGTYFVFVDGYGDEAGGYRLQVMTRDTPTLADVCRGARPLPAGSRVVGTLGDGFDNVHAACGSEAKGLDAPFRFDLAARSRVRFTMKSNDFHPVVHVRRVCDDAATEMGCSDSGYGEDESTWAGVLDAGTYAVFADTSEEGASGAFTMSAETTPEVWGASSGAPAGDGCGDALQLTALSGKVEGDTFAARDDVPISCAPSGGADIVYRLDLARRSRVTARLSGDETSHALAFMRTCGERSSELTCGLLVDRVVDAGTYFLVADGARGDSLGRFAISYRVRDMIDVDAACSKAPLLAAGRKVTGTTVGAGDRFSSACGRAHEKSAPDRVYRVAVPRRMLLRARLERPQSFDAILSLRRTCSEDASEIKCVFLSDGTVGSDPPLQVLVDPGTYYLVVDGAGASPEGAFSLRWEEAEEPTPKRKPAR